MRHRSRTGFTLIEVLVVIAIIALIAGIVFPAVTRGLRTAKRNVAASEAKSIAGAIRMFYDDYGWLPVPPDEQGGDDDVFTSDEDGYTSKDIIKILLGDKSKDPDDPNEKPINPKQKVYLDTDVATSDGTMLDPWGTQYSVLLDLNFDGRLTYRGSEFTQRAIVISSGRDLTLVPVTDTTTDGDDMTSVLIDDD